MLLMHYIIDIIYITPTKNVLTSFTYFTKQFSLILDILKFIKFSLCKGF